MNGPVVGVVGARVSPEVQRVRRALRIRGARTLFVDLSGFPTVHHASVTLDELRAGRNDLGDARVWLLRHLEAPQRINDELPNAARRELREDVEEALVTDRETRAFLESLAWSLFDVARVINDPDATALHGRKPLLTARLRRAGVPVPDSLTTTDRASAQAFVDDLQGEAICKAAAGGGEARLAHDVLNALPADATTLHGPLLLQRRITGGASLRAYVVDDRMVSCREILHGDVVDWRTDQQGLRTIEKRPEVDAAAREACAAVGLTYAGIDLELDGDGAPWVLDVNPSPLFASYESVSGDDVAGPLADVLIAETRR